MPGEQREALARVQRELASIGDVSWTRQDAFHLTLAFLGEVDARGLDAALRALDRAPCMRASAMLAGLGGFPLQAAARVLWVGVEGAGEELRAIARDLRVVDGREHESFVPHVTIGRARAGSAVDLRAAASRIGETCASTFPLSPIVLYESVRGAGGSRYVEIARKD